MFASRSAVALGIAAVVMSLGVAGCSSDGANGSASGEPESSGPYVMSGLDRPAGQSQAPVLTVKIENTRDGQVNVAPADLVTELPVEGGLTRLAAFYESEVPKRVGPVRSARNSDIGLVQPANSVLVASGGHESTIKALQAAGITMVLEDSPAITRDPSRPTSYNLFADLAQIQSQHADQLPSQSYLDFGEFTGTGGKPAKKVDVVFSGSSRESWNLDKAGDAWRRQSNGDYAANTLLIFTVEETDAGYIDAAGSRVPIVESTGTGKGWIVTDGQAYEITWSKASTQDTWQIADAAGTSLKVPAGKTWISLIPNDTGSVTFS